MKIDGTYIEAHVEPDGGFCIFHDCAPPQAYYRSEESPLELPTLIFSLVYIINCFFLSNAIKTYLYQKVDFVWNCAHFAFDWIFNVWMLV